MAQLTSEQTNGFVRTKTQNSISNITLNVNTNSIVPQGAQNVQVSNVNIVSQPSYPSALFGPWSTTMGTITTTPVCLDQFGNQKHAQGSWHEVPYSSSDTTNSVFTAGGGGTANVIFTYDVSWTDPAAPGITYSSVGIQETESVSVDQEVTTQQKTKTFRCYQGGVTCY